jgi:hypothetical protein
MGSIVTQISEHGTVEACDLNKGIKELWKRDLIDAPEAQFRSSRSISKETMDEGFTLKQQYHDRYEQAISAPLVKISFRFMVDTGNYCDHFLIESSIGKLTFPMHSKQKEHVQNVIRKILELN